MSVADVDALGLELRSPGCAWAAQRAWGKLSAAMVAAFNRD
ncbi:MAG: hypothetical protein ACFCVB_18355 [Nodosilinea sp.]